MATEGAGGASSGIQFTITWPERAATLVIERDTSGGFGTSVVIATLPPTTLSYTDPLPLDGVTYYYRAKHTQTGYTTSAWSSTVSDTPYEL